jgi:putative ABC transport system substrate-binding protein
MAIDIRRRGFISVLGGAAAWPLTARAQQPAMPVIGFLNGATSTGWAPYVAAFLQGLSETGYVEGRNVTIEYRWAEGQYDRLPAMAGDLVHRQVTVIAATGGTSSVRAAKTATTAIPIVFTSGADAVALGLVGSLSRPGGNVTGVNFLVNLMGAKRLELLHQLVPGATLVAFLINPNNPDSESQSSEVRLAARDLGVEVYVLKASSEHDIDMAFATLTQQRAGALLVGSDTFLNNRRNRSRRWRHTMPSRRATIYASLSRLVAYSAMGPALRMHIAKPASTSAEFLRAKSLRTCRLCNRPNSSSSSTSRPPRHSISKFPTSCSRSPTR